MGMEEYSLRKMWQITTPLHAFSFLFMTSYIIIKTLVSLFFYQYVICYRNVKHTTHNTHKREKANGEKVI